MANMASAVLAQSTQRAEHTVEFDGGELTFREPNGRKAMSMLSNLADDIDGEDGEKNYEASCRMIQLTWVDENGENVLGEKDYMDVLDKVGIKALTALAQGATEVCQSFLDIEGNQETS